MSIFPAKILVATDGSADADLALSTAVDLANCSDSELHLITVAPSAPDPVYATHESGFRYETYEEAMQAVRDNARHILDEQAEKIERMGGHVAEVHLKTDERRDQAIVHLADEIGAGLIVMGSRVLGVLMRSLMVSVSDSAVRHAHCPAIIVRH